MWHIGVWTGTKIRRNSRGGALFIVHTKGEKYIESISIDHRGILILYHEVQNMGQIVLKEHVYRNNIYRCI